MRLVQDLQSTWIINSFGSFFGSNCYIKLQALSYQRSRATIVYLCNVDLPIIIVEIGVKTQQNSKIYVNK